MIRDRVRDPRIPDTPDDVGAELCDAAQRATAAAYWRIGYAACLAKPRTWRDDIPAGVIIGADFELHSRREG